MQKEEAAIESYFGRMSKAAGREEGGEEDSSEQVSIHDVQQGEVVSDRAPLSSWAGLTPNRLQAYSSTVLMHCRITIPALPALALACLLGASCGTKERDAAPAREVPSQPSAGADETRMVSAQASGDHVPSEAGGAARRRTRVLEMYDPGFRFSGPSRKDKAVERAAGRAPDGIHVDNESQAPTPFLPPPTAAPDREERSIWLDILYDRDGQDGDETADRDDPFQRLWGGTEEAAQDASSLLDPYEQMLSSYRELMAAEEEKVEQQLRGDSMEGDPFASLREVDPYFDRGASSADEFEPALAGLLQQASRGIGHNALEELSSEDLMALANEQPFSPTIEAQDDGDEFEASSWDPTAWRGLLGNGAEPDVALEVGQPDAAADAWQRPILIGRADDADHDFAGLGALRRDLMRINFTELDEPTPSFAPTAVDTRGQSGTDRMQEFGTHLHPTETSTTEDPFSARERFGESPHHTGRLNPRDGQMSPSFGAEEGLLERIDGRDGERSDPRFGDSERTRESGRRTIFDPRETGDPFGEQDRFRTRDWGDLGR